jgi:hypothetical protein
MIKLHFLFDFPVVQAFQIFDMLRRSRGAGTRGWRFF